MGHSRPGLGGVYHRACGRHHRYRRDRTIGRCGTAGWAFARCCSVQRRLRPGLFPAFWNGRSDRTGGRRTRSARRAVAYGPSHGRCSPVKCSASGALLSHLSRVCDRAGSTTRCSGGVCRVYGHTHVVGAVGAHQFCAVGMVLRSGRCAHRHVAANSHQRHQYRAQRLVCSWAGLGRSRRRLGHCYRARRCRCRRGGHRHTPLWRHQVDPCQYDPCGPARRCGDQADDRFEPGSYHPLGGPDGRLCLFRRARGAYGRDRIGVQCHSAAAVFGLGILFRRNRHGLRAVVRQSGRGALASGFRARDQTHAGLGPADRGNAKRSFAQLWVAGHRSDDHQHRSARNGPDLSGDVSPDPAYRDACLRL